MSFDPPAIFLSSSLPAAEWQTVSRAASMQSRRNLGRPDVRRRHASKWGKALPVCSWTHTVHKLCLTCLKKNLKLKLTACTRARIAEYMQRMGRRCCCSQSYLKAQSHPRIQSVASHRLSEFGTTCGLSTYHKNLHCRSCMAASVRNQWLQADIHYLLCKLSRYARDGTLEKAISKACLHAIDLRRRQSQGVEVWHNMQPFSIS